MFKKIMLFTLILLPAILILLIQQANAAVPAPSIVTVDVQKVLRDSTAAKGIRDQLEAKRNVYEAEVKKEEERLRGIEQDVLKNHATMTKEALAEKQKSLRTDVSNLQRKVMARRKALDDAFGESMKQVRDALAVIVIDTAKAQHANIVLPKEGTMWIAPELEITDTVVSQLNAKLPKVTVSVAAPKQ